MELLLEFQKCIFHTGLEWSRALFHHMLDGLEALQLGSSRACAWEFLQIRCWITQKGVPFPRALHKHLLKGFPGPFDGVLDGVGEMLHCAQWDGLLWWILGVSVGLSQLWQNHLYICLGGG